MASQILTLHLPDSTYQRLVDLAQRSERPLEETLHLLNTALETDLERSPKIEAQLNQLSLLTDDELWKAATTIASEAENDLMQELLEKQQREGLTPNEAEQIQVLANRFNQIMMVRAKSAVILTERGHDISQLPASLFLAKSL